MNKIRCVIVDDEKLGIDSLRWELNRLDHPIEVIAIFNNPEEAIPFLRKEKVDLLFLDIQMPQMTGFEMLNEISNQTFKTIFVTAYDEYALKAFKYSALEYLLKPADKEELNQAITRYLKNPKIVPDTSKQVEIHNAVLNGQLPEKVVFSTNEAYEFINTADIIYCQADSNYTIIHYNDKRLLVSKTLKETESLLDDYSFMRIHQSYLINPRRITRYIKTAGGSVVMDNDKELSVAKSKKDQLIEYLSIG